MAEARRLHEEIAIRQYSPGMENEIVELLIDTFGGWPKFELKDGLSSQEFWRWKYLQNPVDKLLVFVAEHDDEIVGCFHSNPCKVLIGNNVYLSNSGTDLAVDPNHRKKGLYNSMLSSMTKLEKETGFCFHFGVSNNQVLLDHYRRHPDQYLFSPHQGNVHVRINDIELHERNTENIPLYKRVGFKGLKAFQPIIHRAPEILEDELRLCNVDEFPASINKFWRKISGSYNFIVVKKKEYLDWRYCEHRVNKYQVMLAMSGDEIQGYCVYKLDKYNVEYPRGYIIDLVALPGRNDASYLMAKEVLDRFDEEDVNYIRWQINDGHPDTGIAASLGFINSREKNYLAYTSDGLNVGEDHRIFRNSSSDETYFCYGDYDWI